MALDDVTDYEDGQGEQAVLADGERPRRRTTSSASGSSGADEFQMSL